MTQAAGGLHMLDTNIISALARDPQGRVAARIAGVGDDAVCVSIITAAALRFGCARKGSARLTAQIDAILSAVQVQPFDVPADAAYGTLRAAVETAGTPVGPNDMLIAAHAIALGAVLVTANTAEFSRIPGLRVVNWLAGV